MNILEVEDLLDYISSFLNIDDKISYFHFLQILNKRTAPKLETKIKRDIGELFSYYSSIITQITSYRILSDHGFLVDDNLFSCFVWSEDIKNFHIRLKNNELNRIEFLIIERLIPKYKK